MIKSYGVGFGLESLALALTSFIMSVGLEGQVLGLGLDLGLGLALALALRVKFLALALRLKSFVLVLASDYVSLTPTLITHNDHDRLTVCR